MKEYLDIVNEYGEPTGETVERSIAHLEGIPHRTSHLWVVRRKNGGIEILLQKRSFNKSFPGCYDISSAGHIPAGDEFIPSAIRELKEELGITADESELVYCGDRFIVWDDVFFGKPYHDRQYTRVFLIWLDLEESQFTLQEEEVDSIRWMDLEECIEGVRNGSFENCIALEELDMVRRKALEMIAVSVEQMRRSDAYTIEHFVPGKELMYRAAKGVYDAYDGWTGRAIAIIVGGGNNGGDGYALAGILKREGIDSVIYKVSEKMTDDGRYYHDIAADLGVKICSFAEDTDLSPYDIVVDCILGTGFRGDVRGLAADAIKAVNESNAYVISVDINSGMNGDTGEASTAVRSDLTVSIGYYKQGLFRGQAEEYIGKLVNTDIGIVLI